MVGLNSSEIDVEDIVQSVHAEDGLMGVHRRLEGYVELLYFLSDF